MSWFKNKRDNMEYLKGKIEGLMERTSYMEEKIIYNHNILSKKIRELYSQLESTERNLLKGLSELGNEMFLPTGLKGKIEKLENELEELIDLSPYNLINQHEAILYEIQQRIDGVETNIQNIKHSVARILSDSL